MHKAHRFETKVNEITSIPTIAKGTTPNGLVLVNGRNIVIAENCNSIIIEHKNNETIIRGFKGQISDYYNHPDNNYDTFTPETHRTTKIKFKFLRTSDRPKNKSLTVFEIYHINNSSYAVDKISIQ